MPKEKVQEPAKLAAHTYTNTTADMDINLTIAGSINLDKDFPEEPIGARLILEPIDNMDIECVPSEILGGGMIYRRKGSKLSLPESEVKQIHMELMKKAQPAVVRAVGTLTIPIYVGDVVKVFLNQFETEINTNGKDYLVYPERCIITKIK